jgi:hypothetical protein
MPTSPEPRGPVQSGQEDRAALDRVQAYLRLLGLPARERLDLAARATAGTSQAQSAMAALLDLLDPASGPAGPGRAEAMPPVCRGHMVPERIDRRPWLTLALAAWVPLRREATTLLNTRTYLLAVLSVLLLILDLVGLPL